MKTELRKSIANVIAIMTIAGFLFGFAAVRSVGAEIKPAVSFWVDPQAINLSTSSYHVGDKFNVTLWANTYVDASNYGVYVWQVTMNFNSSLLNITGAGYTGSGGGKSDFFNGHNTVPVTPLITSSSVSTGESLVGATDLRIPGNGSLCWFEMQIASAPTGSNTLTGTLDINNTDTYFLGGDLNEVASTKYSAQYSFGPDMTPPTVGTVSRDPATANVPPQTQVNITSIITDNPGGSGMMNATISYTTDNSTWLNVTMAPLNSTAWTGIIPGTTNGTTVWYKIIAYDNDGNMGVSESVFSYYVVVPEFTGAILIAMLALLAAAMIAYRKKIVRLP